MSGFAIKQNGRPMNASAIKLSKVSKRYGKRRVLHDVSFEVHQSELLALVGSNGAGKSTLIKIVLGLCEPSSGSVELFGGKSKKELSLMRTRVGYVPDSCGAYQSLSAAENLRIRCAEWGLDANREIPRVLSLVGGADRKLDRGAVRTGGSHVQQGEGRALPPGDGGRHGAHRRRGVRGGHGGRGQEVGDGAPPAQLHRRGL